MEKKRLYAVDELRGLAVVLMVIYHLIVDLSMFGYPISPTSMTTRPIGFVSAFLFILVAGFSSRLSRNNARRSLKLFAAAFVISGVTGVLSFAPDIRFGILHFMALAILLFELGRKVFDKIPPVFGLVLFFGLYLLTYTLSEGRLLGFELPSWLFQSKELYWLGLPSADFSSGDYYPLIPHFFLFMSGAMAAGLVNLQNPPQLLQKSFISPLGVVGRHSLIIYFLHQPIVYGLVRLFSWLTK